jgi:hypothetical protein
MRTASAIGFVAIRWRDSRLRRNITGLMIVFFGSHEARPRKKLGKS